MAARMWLKLCFIALVLAISVCCITASSVSLYLSETDTNYMIEYNLNESIVEATREFCNDAVQNFCDEVRDILFDDLYGVKYTPSQPRSNIDDWYSSRTTVTRYLQQRFGFTAYLEIGCGTNQTFEVSSRLFPRAAHCVDPIQSGTHRLTSDAFFQYNTVDPSAGTFRTVYDLVFVDGLHESTQALRGVENSLAVLTPPPSILPSPDPTADPDAPRQYPHGGIILMHDCNPRQERYQEREESGKVDMNMWLGDVWRAVVVLRMREDLDVITGDFDLGLAMVRRGRNTQPLSPEILAYLHSFNPPSRLMTDLPYSFLQQHRQELLRLRTIAEVKQWVG